MAVKLTDSQKAAISQNGSVIVSAAAGSGKTYVLVQRIIEKLTRKENPISADRLLVVTFTVAAAAEMRSRIEKGLDEYCRNNPSDTAAAKQKLILQTSKISTIDSFCIDMVRENFSKAGVSPDFKIAEERDIILINEKAMEIVFEKHFEARTPEFIELLNAFGAMYDEKPLAEAIEEIYEKSQNMPFPNVWLQTMKQRYDDSSLNFWCSVAFEEALKRINGICRFINASKYIFEKDEIAKKAYSPNFELAKEKAENIKEKIAQKNWDNVIKALNEFTFGKISTPKGYANSPGAIAVKSLKQLCEAQLKKISSLFGDSYEITKSQYLKNAPLNKMLLTLAIEYTKAVEEEKKQRNIYTFSDIEHFAFSLVCEHKNGEIVLKEDAKEYIDDFDEILVDEYQDVNNLQDTFFYFLSDKGKHLFVVGDVKQSIYGFRGANPENFIAKMNNAVDYKEALQTDLKAILLDSNFRSKSGICDFVNFMFEKLMTKENCGISYKDTEKLYPKAEFPDLSAPAAEVHIIDTKGQNERTTEAAYIADCILKIMESGKVIRDKQTGKLRNARYSDFAIIIRTMKNNSPVVAEELKKRNIPVSYTKEAFLESKEIRIMISLLSVIDNPTKEVELLSVMMSPLFRFTPDDMAEIRCTDKKVNLYSAVIANANKGNDRCKQFLNFIAELRRSTVILPLPKLISKIYDMTDLLSICEMMSDGQARKANLVRFMELAVSFSSSGNNGISNFINNLKKMPEGKLKGATLTAGNNSVKIMSVHYSKGLQFPVCFFAFTGTPFNTSDQKKSIIIDTKYGVSFKYYDEQGSITTIDKKLLASFSLNTMLKEELRMLYVAATRAEDKIIVTMAKKDPNSLISKSALMLTATDGEVTEDIYLSANKFSDWIIPCMLLHPDSEALREAAGVSFKTEPREKLGIQIHTYQANESISKPEALEQSEEEVVKEIRKRIEYKYPFNALRYIESKSSVSNIVHKQQTNDYDFTSKPAFTEKSGLTAAGKGTAVHKIMQFMDYTAAKNNLTEEIERLKEWEYISETEAKVDTVNIQRFIDSALFERICAAQKVEREMQFLTFMPIETVEKNIPKQLSNEKIIVQGAVDLMFQENDGIVIVDFKTDRGKNPQKLIDTYGKQLEVYAAACEKIIGLPVKEKIIYSLVLDAAIVV